MDGDNESHRSIISIDDLSDPEISVILGRAREYLAGTSPPGFAPFAAGLLFLGSSLRTRVGFSTATIRLGGVPVDVSERRSGTEMSSSESLVDTLVTLGGMLDLLVTRTPMQLPPVARTLPSPVINGGEVGGEHPTQALIDLLAIQEECGAIHELRIGLCGDLGARVTRSLVKLLDRTPPRQLSLMAPPERRPSDLPVGDELLRRITWFDQGEFSDLDVLYMVGLAPGDGSDRLDESQRAGFALNGTTIAALSAGAVVLSPLPVVDEIAPEVREDPRIRMFAQSDRGVAVRMACIEYCLGTCHQSTGVTLADGI